MKNIYTILDLQKKVDKLYEVGIVKGEEVGFNCLRNLYSIKLGSTTYIMGSPYSGKTELWFEFLINLSEKKGWKHVIFTPETGSREEIVAELCSKYLMKPFYNYENRMTEDEKYRAMAWLNEHFYIFDPDEVITPTQFYDEINALENTLSIKVHTTTLDPYNELRNDLNGNGGRQDLYIEELLGMVRRNARLKNRHNCIITHAANQMPKEENGVVYYPPPTARDYAGGQAWFRKGMGMIAIWRPPFGLSDKNGQEYKENETHVIVQKVKPKGTGMRGTAKLFFDIKKNRFYELSITGLERYANQVDTTPTEVQNKITPNLNFKEEIPF